MASGKSANGSSTDTAWYKNPGVWLGGFSLVVSVFTLVFLEWPERISKPEVDLVMPTKVRLAQDAERQPALVRVFLQPAFVSTGRSTRAEVITDLRLHVTREKDEECREFEVEWVGTVGADPEGRHGPTLEIEGGPSPLAVTREAPQTGLYAFRPLQAPDDPFFVGEGGTYLMTLVGKRAVKKGEDLVGTIRVDSVSQSELRVALKRTEGLDLDFRNRYWMYDAETVNKDVRCLNR